MGYGCETTEPENVFLSGKSVLMEMADVLVMMRHQFHDKASSLHCTMDIRPIDSIHSKPWQNERQHHYVKNARALLLAGISSCWPFKM